MPPSYCSHEWVSHQHIPCTCSAFPTERPLVTATIPFRVDPKTTTIICWFCMVSLPIGSTAWARLFIAGAGFAMPDRKCENSIQVIQCEVQCVFIHKLGVVTKWPLGNVEFKILDLILNEVSESQSEYIFGVNSRVGVLCEHVWSLLSGFEV